MPGATAPIVMRVILAPGLRHLLALLPPSEGELRMFYRQFGHGRSLDAGRIPQVVIDWSLALERYTDTIRHEMAQIAATGSCWRGYDPSLRPDSRLLQSIRSPIYFLTGPKDPFGNAEVVRRLVAELPNAEMELLNGAGHWPWLDDLDHAAHVIRQFLDTRAQSRRSA